MPVVNLKPINVQRGIWTIVGISPLVHHKWSEKAKREIREKQAGKKTKDREKRDPEAEATASMHVTPDGQYGIPAGAVKKCIINAAHKDIGIEKTLVRKSLFIVSQNEDHTLPMRCSDPIIREDYVTVGQGSADLRYRPYFHEWEADIEIEYNADNLTVDDITKLLDLAGFGVGLLEMRPERGGDFGRFRVKEAESNQQSEEEAA